MVFIESIWKFLGSPFLDPKTIDVLTFYIVLLGLLGGIIGWFVRRRLATHPFVMSFCDKNPYDSIEVSYTKKKIINGVQGLFPDKFVTAIYLKKELSFEQIDIRFVKRNYFSRSYFTWRFLRPVFCHWEDIRDEKMVRVEKVRDLNVENSPKEVIPRFRIGKDLRGGIYGYYNPSYSCPKGSYLVYEVKLYINPNLEDRWDGYISFEHYRGGNHRAYARRKVIIVNAKLEEKECPQSSKSDP